MARTFDDLRGNDLIWNYVVSDWLMGEEPPAFDLLTWNADSTRMPAEMHSVLPARCYLENRLARGTMEMLGRRTGWMPSTPTSTTSRRRRTTSPRGGRATPHPGCSAATCDSCSARSGHIAGVVNPPGGKRTLRTNDAQPAEPEAWYSGSDIAQRSWWEDWAPWAKAHAGRRQAPPPLGNENYPVLGDAPGTYVFG